MKALACVFPQKFPASRCAFGPWIWTFFTGNLSCKNLPKPMSDFYWIACWEIPHYLRGKTKLNSRGDFVRPSSTAGARIRQIAPTAQIIQRGRGALKKPTTSLPAMDAPGTPRDADTLDCA